MVRQLPASSGAGASGWVSRPEDGLVVFGFGGGEDGLDEGVAGLEVRDGGDGGSGVETDDGGGEEGGEDGEEGDEVVWESHFASKMYVGGVCCCCCCCCCCLLLVVVVQ